MSGRFQLDPRAPKPARELPPPPAPIAKPPGAPSPPPAPRPMAAPAGAAPRTNRRALMLAGVVIALLLVGGAVAVFVATSLGYPDKYVLDPNEYPSGMSTAPLSSSEREQLGVTRNPGEIDREQLADQYQGSEEGGPERGNAQVLATSDGARVAILVLKYANEDDAKDGASRMRALCSFANGAVLRDGDVVVAVLPDDGASRTQVRAVANALLEKASGLDAVCGL